MEDTETHRPHLVICMDGDDEAKTGFDPSCNNIPKYTSKNKGKRNRKGNTNKMPQQKIKQRVSNRETATVSSQTDHEPGRSNYTTGANGNIGGGNDNAGNITTIQVNVLNGVRLETFLLVLGLILYFVLPLRPL